MRQRSVRGLSRLPKDLLPIYLSAETHAEYIETTLKLMESLKYTSFKLVRQKGFQVTWEYALSGPPGEMALDCSRGPDWVTANDIRRRLVYIETESRLLQWFDLFARREPDFP